MDTLKQMYASQARAIVAIRDSAITEALKDRGGGGDRHNSWSAQLL